MTGGLILAAKVSTHMGGFKPIMPLNGFPMLRMTYQSLKNAGVDLICVVTGYRSEDCERALSGTDAIFAYNSEYGKGDALLSVKVGLEKLRCCDGVFIIPADTPLVQPETFGLLKLSAAASTYPAFRGQKGYPPFVKKRCFDKIISFEGAGGFRAVLDEIPSVIIATGDEGVVLNADRREDFEVVEKLARKRRGVSEKIYTGIWDEAELLPNIRSHVAAVGGLSAEMAETLIKQGYCLDVELCRSGGALHDILRLEKAHFIKGAAYIRSKGYEAIADIIRYHNDFEENSAEDFDEITIVCLSDKLFKRDVRVTAAQRYSPAKETFGENTEIGRRIRRDEKKCVELLKKYEEITGINLERNI